MILYVTPPHWHNTSLVWKDYKLKDFISSAHTAITFWFCLWDWLMAQMMPPPCRAWCAIPAYFTIKAYCLFLALAPATCSKQHCFYRLKFSWYWLIFLRICIEKDKIVDEARQYNTPGDKYSGARLHFYYFVYRESASRQETLSMRPCSDLFRDSDGILRLHLRHLVFIAFAAARSFRRLLMDGRLLMPISWDMHELSFRCRHWFAFAEKSYLISRPFPCFIVRCFYGRLITAQWCFYIVARFSWSS